MSVQFLLNVPHSRLQTTDTHRDRARPCPHIQPPLCKGRCRTNVRRRDCEVDFIRIYKNPSVIFQKKNDSSLYKGAFVGQPQGLSLRYDIEFNLIATVSYNISTNFHGGSKPPPYNVKGNLRVVIRMLAN